MKIDRNKIEQEFKKNAYIFENYTKHSLEYLKKYLPYFDEEISKREEKIQKMLIEIDILKEEKANRIKEIERLENQDRKIVIEIEERKKIYKWDSYCLCIDLKEVTINNENIRTIDTKHLVFNERVTKRNEYLLDWIKNYNVSSIKTNIDISNFIKEFNLNHIDIIMDENI